MMTADIYSKRQNKLSFTINVVKAQFQEKIRKEKFEQRFGISVWGERCLIGMASPTPDVPVKIVACSVNDRFRMNITTKLADMACPEKIAESLSKSGIIRSRHEQDCIDGDKKFLDGAGGVLETLSLCETYGEIYGGRKVQTYPVYFPNSNPVRKY